MTFALPPLNALRAFEAAARCGSYVTAASELRVTAAAVSQQIRKLEDHLGKQLFTRHNNRVVLTDAGAAIFGTIHRAFEDMAQTTALAMGAKPRSRLLISTLPSVSERWLVPRLARFAARHPEFRFELRSEDVSLAGSGAEADLRLDYGAAAAPQMEVHLILQDQVLPLCAPSYLERLGRQVAPDLAQVPDDDFIHTDWGRDFASRPSWRAWCAAYAPARAIAVGGVQTSHSGLALDLALRGLGVALGQEMLAEEELRDGRLLRLSPHALALGHGYYLKYPKAKARKPLLGALVAFLLGDAATA